MKAPKGFDRFNPWYTGLNANKSGVIVPVNCTACLGKWTGDLAAAYGGSPLTMSGTCNHHVSATQAQLNSGLCLAMIQSSNAFTISWPASELRIFALKTIQAQLVDPQANLLLVNTPNLIIADIVTGNRAVLGAYSYYSTTPTSLTITSQDSAAADIVSPEGSQSASGTIALGVSGDGSIFSFSTGGTDYAKVVGFQFTTTNSMALAVAGAVNMSPNWISGMEAEVLTNASQISPLFSLPDMSADGITTVADFCGNVII